MFLVSVLSVFSSGSLFLCQWVLKIQDNLFSDRPYADVLDPFGGILCRWEK